MRFKRSYKKDKRFFQKSVNQVHSKNVSGYKIPRGGVRL